jgi:gamma-glutamylcyclotransferase
MPLYFAFGSNMDAAQMATRCPGATSLGTATLAAHRLVFRGPSRKRGGGVLSVDADPSCGVRGVLYEVTTDHLEALDRFEGAPEWYVRAQQAVMTDTGAVHTATLYRLPHQVQQMPPTPAYVDQVALAFDALSFCRDPLDEAVSRAKETK